MVPAVLWSAPPDHVAPSDCWHARRRSRPDRLLAAHQQQGHRTGLRGLGMRLDLENRRSVQRPAPWRSARLCIWSSAQADFSGTMSAGTSRDFSTTTGSYLVSEWRKILITCVPQGSQTAPDLSRIDFRTKHGVKFADQRRSTTFCRRSLGNFSKTPGMGCSESFRAQPKARRPNTEDPTRRSNPPRRRRGRAAARLGLSWPRSPRLPADQIRQPRDFTQASYAILEILPEVDSQPPARLLQARKGVPRRRPKSLRVLPLIFRFLT